jgi:hypothetical protein
MDAPGLAGQAHDLPPQARMTMGLLLTWVLTPLLRLDDSEQGTKRSTACLELLDAGFAAVGDEPPDSLVDQVGSAEELQVDEEPEGPEVFRLDFLAALLYALKSGQGDEKSFRSCFVRVRDSLDLATDHGLTESPTLEADVLRVIATLEEARAMDQALVQELRAVLQPDYDHLASGG